MYPILIGYVLLSLTFFVFPFKKKKRNLEHSYFSQAFRREGVLHISHRGGSRDNMENTMPAFQHAVRSKTNMLEMDVCFTKDKQVVVVHDSLLSRVTEENKHSDQFNYSELPAFRKRVRLDFAENQYIETKSEQFPLLEDVFKTFPTSLINVEIKTPHLEINQAVNNLIIKYNREKLTIWGARYSQDSDELFKLNPNIPRFFSFQRVLKLYGCYILGFLPFVNIEEDSIQIPLLTEDLYKWKMSFAETPKERFMVWFGYKFIGVLNSISGPLFYHLNKRGVLVIYWVLNSEKDFERAVKQNAHGIMTDSPVLLAQFLENRHKLIK